jgi:hypothetical protein
MERDAVLAALRAHEPYLRRAGITRLSLFGSTARGDASPDSDVDLLATFDESRQLSALDIVGLQLHLSKLLKCEVDLSEETALKPRVRDKAALEAVRAF